MELTFILKKAVSAMIMPMSIGLILFFLGLILLFKNKHKLSKIFLIISFIWISLFSYVQFSNLLLKPLESQYETIKEIPKDIRYILLLGGDRYNRGWEALRLYNLIPNAKIITSGYSWGKLESDASRTAKLLIDAGVKKEDIVSFGSPKDTKEEAINIKKFLKDEPFILVTSASHMPRALAIFKNEGCNAFPSATNYWIRDTDKVIATPNGYGLFKSDKAWHEYIGLIWGKLRGQF